MRKFTTASLFICAATFTLTLFASSAPAPQPKEKGEDLQVGSGEAGVYGGTLVMGQRAEVKTLNPVLA
ncbi:MAG TPA: hypothetical protein VJ453_04265, partial [Terriglobales bacterium]|nr:hypothetical protein [Terriglobales bacterium]